MARLCVGCGLETDDAGRLVAAVSGTWGDDRLQFDCTDTGGEPVYCDSAGQLRTAPGHTTTRWFDNGTAFDGPRTLSQGFDWYTPIDLTYSNPHTCRSVWLLAVGRVEATYTLNAGSAYRLRAGAPTLDTPSAGGVDLARDSQHSSLGVRVVTVTGPVFSTLLLAPGETRTISTSLTTQCLSGQIQIHEHRYWMSSLGSTV